MGDPGATHGHRIFGNVLNDGPCSFEEYGGTWPTPTDPPDPPVTTPPYTGYPFRCASNTGGGGNAYDYHLHLESCRICAGDVPRPAHSGSYYFHHQCCQVESDPYLNNGTASSVATNGVIGPTGGQWVYPSNGSAFDLLTGVTSDYVFLRFWFRLVDNWQNANHTTLGGVLDSFKFIRFGCGDAGDTAVYLTTGIVPTYYDEVDGWDYNIVLAGTTRRAYGHVRDGHGNIINLKDDKWHSVCVLWHVLNYTGTDPNVEISVWWDDWNCEHAANLTSANGYEGSLGSGMTRIYITENFQSVYPAHLIGTDIDDIEIWDGYPTTAELQGSGVAMPLENDGQRRYVRVRVQDANGNVSPWSQTAYFDMAITATGAITLSPVGVLATSKMSKLITGSAAITLGPVGVLAHLQGPTSDPVPVRVGGIGLGMGMGL